MKSRFPVLGQFAFGSGTAGECHLLLAFGYGFGLIEHEPFSRRSFCLRRSIASNTGSFAHRRDLCWCDPWPSLCL